MINFVFHGTRHVLYRLSFIEAACIELSDSERLCRNFNITQSTVCIKKSERLLSIQSLDHIDVGDNRCSNYSLALFIHWGIPKSLSIFTLITRVTKSDEGREWLRFHSPVAFECERRSLTPLKRAHAHVQSHTRTRTAQHPIILSTGGRPLVVAVTHNPTDELVTLTINMSITAAMV